MTALHLYVYYEVREADAAAMLERVHTMQAALVAATSIRARLQQRVDRDANGDRTWMEVYPDAPSGFEAQLAAAVVASAVDTLCGARHVERFEDAA